MQRTRRVRDPTFRYLQQLKETCIQEGASKTVLDGIDGAMSLMAKRDEYCEKMTSAPNETLINIIERTHAHPWEQLHAEGKTKWNLRPGMMSGSLEGEVLRSIVSMSGAKRVLELGMYTGYAALAMAQSLPADGEVVTCEVDPYLEGFAKELFSKSAHAKKIKICIGPAKDTLRTLAQNKEQFDFVFMDADKSGYADYYKIIMDEGLLAPNGTICVDNALFSGAPYSATDDTISSSGKAIKEFNEMISQQPNLHRALLPVRDGMLLLRRKDEVDGKV